MRIKLLNVQLRTCDYENWNLVADLRTADLKKKISGAQHWLSGCTDSSVARGAVAHPIDVAANQSTETNNHVFSISEIVFRTGIDQNDLKHILKRLFRGVANLLKIKLIIQKKKTKKTLKHGRKVGFKFDRLLKNAWIRFHKQIYKLRNRKDYLVIVNYQ